MLKRPSTFFAFSFVWLSLVSAGPVSAGPIEEAFFHSGFVTEALVQNWSSIGGNRDYILDLGDPNSSDLQFLLNLQGARNLTLEFERFPGEDTAAVLRRLAARNAEFVSLGAGLPTDEEVERLNRIGFRRMVFVLTGIPGEEEAARLSRLKGEVSLTFVTRSYPRYEDIPPLKAIPSSIPLLFITDYWPWYAHMDVFNMIPQRIRLRVADMFPDEAGLPYLHNIKRLERLQVQTSGDAPSASDWTKFRSQPVNWTATNWVPSETGLRDFAASMSAAAPRSLTVDRDWELTADERRRLEKSPVPVRWIHAAPAGLALSHDRPLGRALAPFLGAYGTRE